MSGVDDQHQTGHKIEFRLDPDGNVGYPAAKCSCRVSLTGYDRPQIEQSFAAHRARERHNAQFAASGTLIVRPRPQATTSTDELRAALAPAITLSGRRADGTFIVRVIGETGLLRARTVLRYSFWAIEREIPAAASASEN